jgi:hypothetical protein
MSLKFNLSGIVLLTGIPGSGKTLRMMQIAREAVKEGRPVFQCGINECTLPGVQEWEDPHAWKDLPPRAVLLVDEAQDHFRTRPGVVAAPVSITDMERIRHTGVCLVLTTQQPTYLDKHLRGLVGRHEHLVEVLAGRTSNVYSFRSVREDITPTALSDAGFELWSHPTDLHGSYKSAEVHTKKLRVPLRILLMALGVVACLGIVVSFFIPSKAASNVSTPSAAPAALASASRVGSPNEKPMDPAEYGAQFQPRFSNMPRSMPIFDGGQPVSEPSVYCMSSGGGDDAQGEYRAPSVTCLTEQGTRWKTDTVVTARSIARYGPSYDPFKQPAEASHGAAQSAGGASPPVTGLPIGITLEADQVSAYGDIGVGNSSAPR